MLYTLPGSPRVEMEPLVIRRGTSYEPIGVLLLAGGDSVSELIPLARSMERQLYALGVDRIDFDGLPEEEIAIQLSSTTLAQLQTSLDEVAAQVRQRSNNTPAGIVGAAPYVSGEGMLTHGSLLSGTLIRGVLGFAVIGAALPVSARLGFLAIVLALAVGVTAGIAAALRPDTLADRLISGIAMTGISVPVFVVAPLLVLVFAVGLGWLPASWSGGNAGVRLLLPVFALALPQIAFITRLTRGSMLEVLGSDFIRTARAQGLGTLTIIRHHALKPALLPVVSYLGPAIAGVLTGAVVVETIFGIPGLGALFVKSGLNRDYTLVMGTVGARIAGRRLGKLLQP